MSPVSCRRYKVQFLDWTLYDTIVFATSESEAISKAQAIYDADGLAGFNLMTAGENGWEANEVQS